MHSIHVIAYAISNLTNMAPIQRLLHTSSTRVASLLAPSYGTVAENLDFPAEPH